MTLFSPRRLRNGKAVTNSATTINYSENHLQMENTYTNFDIENQHAQNDQNSTKSSSHSEDGTNAEIANSQREMGEIKSSLATLSQRISPNTRKC